MVLKILCLFLLPFLFAPTESDSIVDQLKHNITLLIERIWSHVNHTSDPKMMVLRMLDASTKIPSGLMLDTVYDLGNFVECYNTHDDDVFGKYCLGRIPHLGATTNKRIRMHPEHNLTKLMGYSFALCIPSSMEVGEIPGGIMFHESFCYSKQKEPNLSTGAVFTIAVFGIIVLVVVSSTVFDVVVHYKQMKKPNELLVSFSLWSNGLKLFRTSENSKELTCLNGVKALSMLWVVVGHEYYLNLVSPLVNFDQVYEVQYSPSATFVISGSLAVDTFLTITGLITVYTYLHHVTAGGKFNILLYYLHRYLRLTPAFGFVILTEAFLIEHVATGPLWQLQRYLGETCRETWWTSLLYITPFFKRDNCIIPTWYLAVDMQLYWLSPLILIPLSKWPKFGLMALGVLIAAGVAVPFTVGYVEADTFARSAEQYTYLYYVQTYTRFGPYVIGMLAGYIVYKLKTSTSKLRLSPVIVTVLWTLTLTGMFVLVWVVLNDMDTSNVEEKLKNSLVMGFHRSTWALMVSTAIILCVTDHGSAIDGFLSLSIFRFLTKVGYSIYLLHTVLLTARFLSLKNSVSVTELSIVHGFIADYMVAMVIAIFWYLTFEAPIPILEKCIFRLGRP